MNLEPWWEIQHRIEARAHILLADRPRAFSAEDWEWMLGYILSALLGGVGIGFLLWGPK